MTSLLDEPSVLPDTASNVSSESSAASNVSAAAERLRGVATAMRVSFTWLGTRKSLTSEQKALAAESFGAEGQFLSASKKLLNTSHPKFKAVTSVRGKAVSYFRDISLPFPEPGIRLIRQSDISNVNAKLTDLKEELSQAVVDLNGELYALKSSARRRLGTLYNESDYPSTLVGLFDIGWDFPSVEPPNYLRQLNPEIYQQECERVAARFNEAVQLAEQAFLDELSQLVSHLTERLSGSVDGRPKVFRDSAVNNLTEFFRRFQSLNIGSNDQLDELVSRAQNIVQGVQPQDLRDNDQRRQQVATQLSSLDSVLDGLLVDRPRRNLMRRPK